MKKLLIQSFFLLFTLIFCGQNYEVVYDLETNRNNPYLSIKSDYLLYANASSSLFNPIVSDPINLYKRDLKDIKVIWEKKNLKQVDLGSGVNDFSFLDVYYNDLETVYYNTILVNKLAYIKEKNLKFEWEIIEDEKKQILGHDCKKAVTQFRGRLYEAYFAPSINITSGPWKFSGLPGLILSIKSIDDYLIINATSIKEVSDIEIINPIANEKFVTLQEYINDTKRIWLQQLKAISSASKGNEDGGSITLKFDDGIEDLGIGPITYEY
jgi:GLPGLI family protein